MKGKDEKVGKKEQAMERHVKYSAFAKTLVNALYFVTQVLIVPRSVKAKL